DVNMYCSVDDVRTITNISTSDLTDTQVCNLIQFAGYQVNADVQVFREDEKIRYQSVEKQNLMDDTNTTFFTKWYPIGDKNSDFEVNTSDMEVYQIDNDGNRITYTLSTINPDTGEFTLSSAPSSAYYLMVTYYSAPISMSQPHPLIKIANALLAGAWAYTKLNVGKAPRFRTAALTVFRDMDAFRDYYRKYVSILYEINTGKHQHMTGIEGSVNSNASIKVIDIENTIDSSAFIIYRISKTMQSDAYINTESTEAMQSIAYIKVIDNTIIIISNAEIRRTDSTQP
ncbi:unnamed protein product, partial [marine sediment metagenome]